MASPEDSPVLTGERVHLEHASSLVQAIGDVCKFESACGAGSASWVSAWVCPLGAALRSGTHKNLSTVCLVQLALLSESGAGESGGIDAVAEVVEQTVACPRFAAYHEAYAHRLLSQCRSSGCLEPAPAPHKIRHFTAMERFLQAHCRNAIAVFLMSSLCVVLSA